MKRSLRILGFLALAAALPACGISGNGTLTPTVAPQVPQSLSAKIGNHRVTLSWVGSAPATSYTVKRSNVPGGPYTALPLGTVTTTTFVDTGLVNHVTYYYVVSASNSFGQSPDSAEVSGAGALKAIQVSGGSNSGSALLQDGTVWSWGLNVSGGLGNGLTSDSNVPVQAVGLPPITQISIGGRTGFALDEDGRLWSWGDNTRRELGRGPIVFPSSATPGLVDTSTGLPLCSAVSAGWDHALALGRDGTLWSWGFNGGGRLGSNGPDTNRPRQVVLPPGLSVVTSIACGNANSLALSQDGTVWCWGENDSGQLGDPARGYVGSVVPIQVFHLTGAVAIAGGESHAIALRNDGTVWSWGSNRRGQLGNGVGDGINPNDPLPPVPLAAAPVLVGSVGSSPLTGVIAISAQSASNLALRSDGSVWAWGEGYALGDPSVLPTNYRPFAGPVVGLNNQATIGMGHVFAYTAAADGTVWAWGNNSIGEVPFGTGFRQTVAIQLPQLTSVTKIAGGGSPDPFQAPFGGFLIPGEGHGLAISTAGQVWSWGNNNDSQLGLGGPLGTPVTSGAPGLVQKTGPVVLDNVTSIAGGGTHSVFVSSGSVWCAGTNTAGQLGNGNNTASSFCVQTVKAGPMALTNVLAVSAGEAHSVAVLNDTTVWTWGRNNAGQLGIGSTANSNVAVQVQTSPGVFLTGVIAVSAGFDHCVALKSDGTVLAWGDNTWGQAGTGMIDANFPFATAVQNKSPAGDLTGIVEIAAGRFHNLARTAAGTVVSWGDNSQAQLGADPSIAMIWPNSWTLGNLTAPNHPTPFAPPGLFERAAVPVVDASGTPIGGVVGLSAGAYHSVALRNDLSDPTRQSVWTWGGSFNAELGNADATIDSPAVPPFLGNSKITAFSPVPVPVQYTVPTGLGTLRGIASVSAGAHFTLARGSDGTVWGWGSNAQSQLGSDTIFLFNTPVTIDP